MIMNSLNTLFLKNRVTIQQKHVNLCEDSRDNNTEIYCSRQAAFVKKETRLKAGQ